MNKPANPVSPHEALIYAMVTLAAADQAMTDNELMKIGDVVKTLPIFRDFDRERLVKAAEACGAILQKENGLDEVLDVIANTLVPRLSRDGLRAAPWKSPPPTSMSSRRNSASCRCSATVSTSTSSTSPRSSTAPGFATGRCNRPRQGGLAQRNPRFTRDLGVETADVARFGGLRTWWAAIWWRSMVRSSTATRARGAS